MRRFFGEDILDNPDNLFGCPNCAAKRPKGCKAIKEFYIKDPPTILIIQLKRFESSGFSYSKNSLLIKNIEEIYLDKYALISGTLLFALVRRGNIG